MTFAAQSKLQFAFLICYQTLLVFYFLDITEPFRLRLEFNAAECSEKLVTLSHH